MNAEQLAKQFHETYEALAPRNGYETRPETRVFNPESPNGRLMIAVCNEILKSLADKVREECAQVCEKNLYAWNGTSDRNDDYRNAHRKDMRQIRAMKERP